MQAFSQRQRLAATAAMVLATCLALGAMLTFHHHARPVEEMSMSMSNWANSLDSSSRLAHQPPGTRRTKLSAKSDAMKKVVKETEQYVNDLLKNGIEDPRDADLASFVKEAVATNTQPGTGVSASDEEPTGSGSGAEASPKEVMDTLENLKPHWDVNSCQEMLCGMDPKIVDDGPSLQAWKTYHEGMGSWKDLDQVHSITMCIEMIQKSRPDDPGTVAWRDSTYCKYGTQEAEERRQKHEEIVAAQKAGTSANLAANVKEVGASDLKTVADREDPNSEAFDKASISNPDCDKLHPIPGADFLSAGYDPANAKSGSTCTFDTCRTRPIYKWSYNECKTTHTPAGTFKVPDQITVLPKYETTATTKVYQTEKEFEASMAAHAGVSTMTQVGSVTAEAKFGMSAKQSQNEHLAERKVDIQLYTMYAAPSRYDIKREFLEDLQLLPQKFNQGARQYFQFLKKWGRFTVDSAAFGGTLVIDMLFKSKAGDLDISSGVEAALDTVTSTSISAGASSGLRSASLAANSEISLEANGGDPSIAAAITDFSPTTKNTATFRTDFVSWIQSVPLYPRLINTIPKLSLITELMPLQTPNLPKGISQDDIEADRANWKLRKWAMNQAMEVISISPFEAMRSHEKYCEKGFDWQDFDRFAIGSCLFFGVRTPAGLTVAFADRPARDEGKLEIHIGKTKSYMQVWGEKEGWHALWSSEDNRALALADGSLLGKYWVCLKAGKRDSTIVTVGTGDRQFVTEELKVLIRPRYFGLACDENRGGFSDIMVIPQKQFHFFVNAEKVDLESGKLCELQGCAVVNNGPPCTCKVCEGDLILVQDEKQRQVPCKPRNWKMMVSSTPAIDKVASVRLTPNDPTFLRFGGYRLDPSTDLATTELKSATTDSDAKALLNKCAWKAQDENKPGFCLREMANKIEKGEERLLGNGEIVNEKKCGDRFGNGARCCQGKDKHYQNMRQELFFKGARDRVKGFVQGKKRGCKCCEVVDKYVAKSEWECLLPNEKPGDPAFTTQKFKDYAGQLGEEAWMKDSLDSWKGYYDKVMCYTMTTGETYETKNVAFTKELDFRKVVKDFPKVQTSWSMYGSFYAAKEGNYEFCTDSDDGSVIKIDDHAVATWDGFHGWSNIRPSDEKCGGKKGSITLIAGYHNIRVTGFNGGGGIAQVVKYRLPGSKKFQLVPVFQKTWE